MSNHASGSLHYC